MASSVVRVTLAQHYSVHVLEVLCEVERGVDSSVSLDKSFGHRRKWNANVFVTAHSHVTEEIVSFSW